VPYADPERQREFRREQMRRLRAGPNADKYRESRAASMRRYPEKRRMWEAARRARKLEAFVEHVDPSTVFEMHGGMCGVCNEFIAGDFHVDHIVPLSRGGAHAYINVQPAHPMCNLKKGARVPEAT
jgi:5-methylcytosine-specific restriction endonuclease McrA